MFVSPQPGPGPSASVFQAAPADSAALVRDAAWQPFDYDVAARTMTFAHLPREAQQRAVFLDRRFVGAQSKSAPMPIASLDPDEVQAAAGPMHFIFHTGFCCSTLLTRALDIPGVSMGLKEPGVLVSFARHWSNARQAAGALSALSLTLDLLSRPLALGETQIVKPSNVCNHLLPEVLHLRPDAKVLLMYSSLSDFLLAVAKRDIHGRVFARQAFQGLAGAIPLDVTFAPEEQMMQTDLQIAAQLWLMQMSFFNVMATHYGPTRVRAMSGDAFLADTVTALTGASNFFGLGRSEAQWSELAAAPVFHEHAKEQGLPFDASKRSADLAQTRDRHAAEVATAAEWAKRLAAQARVPMALSETLLNAG
jgi:hypothetical protein